MKNLYKAFYGALLVLGLAGVAPEPVFAGGGYHWDTVCNCRRPDFRIQTRIATFAKRRAWSTTSVSSTKLASSAATRG